MLAVAVLERWGYDGFFEHTKQVSEFYRHKRDVFQAAMQRHLADVAEWTPPEAGMFMWCVLQPLPHIDRAHPRGCGDGV